MLKFADGPFCKLIKKSQGVFQKSDIFPVATVRPLSPCRRCRRAAGAPLPCPPVDKDPPPRCGLSLPSSTCWPPLLPLSCSLFPSSRFLLPPPLPRRRRCRPPRGKPSPPRAPPRRAASLHRRNRQGRPPFARARRFSPASGRAAADHLIAGRPPLASSTLA